MSNLISRDTLFSEFENAGWYDNADRDDVAEELLLKAPTVDAVPVVRCGECIYNRSLNCYAFPCHLTGAYPMHSNDFCSRGKQNDGME